MAVGEAEAEDVERLGVAAVEAAGDTLRVEQDVLADEDEADRGQAEVDTAQPARDRAEQRAEQAGEQDGADYRQPSRQPEHRGGVQRAGLLAARQEGVAGVKESAVGGGR